MKMFCVVRPGAQGGLALLMERIAYRANLPYDQTPCCGSKRDAPYFRYILTAGPV
jgi:hypothetical protein